MKFNNVDLTEQTLLKTDEHFAEICQGCIDEVLRGDVKVNDVDTYVIANSLLKEDYLKGRNRNNLTYMQRAYWIQTGECIGLLP